jgi:hypothetical protein
MTSASAMHLNHTPRLVVQVAALAATVAISVAAQANPSTSAPTLPLVIRPDETNQQTLAQLAKLDDLARRIVEDLVAAAGRKNASAQEIADVSRLAMALTWQAHLARQLADQSEAAGYDYLARAGEHETAMRKAAADFRAGGKVRTDVMDREMRALVDAAMRRFPELKSRAATDVEAVEVELVKIIAPIRRYQVWLEGSDRSSFRHLAELYRDVQLAASQLRQSRLAEQLAPLVAESRPKFDELPAQLAEAAEALQGSETVDWRGESLAGPDLVLRAFEAWRQVEIQTQRTRMLLLASRGSATTVPAEVEQLSAEHAKFQAQMIEGLAAIVAADAARVAPQHARELYRKYLDRLARGAIVCDRAAVRAAWEPPLAAIADKEPGLKVDVQNYVRATSPLLRWRRELVDLELGVRSKVDTDIQGVLNQAIRPSSGGPALLTENAPNTRAALLSSAAVVLPRIGERAGGRPASVRDLVGLGAGKTIASYHDRVYARATVPYSKALESQVDALRMMLLVTPTQGPLSLDAAIALAAAEDGTYRAVGGIVSEVTLEPLLSRFATLPDRSRGLLLLKELPAEIQASDLRNAVLARFDLAPRWVAHETFIVDLLEPPTPSAAPPPAAASQPVAQAE